MISVVDASNGGCRIGVVENGTNRTFRAGVSLCGQFEVGDEVEYNFTGEGERAVLLLLRTTKSRSGETPAEAKARKERQH